MNNPRRTLSASILSLEAIALGLTTPVMITVADVATGAALTVGLGLALACILAAGMLRHEWAYWLGHLIQVAAVALGLVVPFMFVLGPVFAALWGTAYWLGLKIERERAAAYAAFGSGGPSGSPGPDDRPGVPEA